MEYTYIYIVGQDCIPQKISLQANDKLSMTIIVLPGVSCDLPIQIDLEGEGINVNINGLYLCTTEEKVSFGIKLNHLYPNCKSSQLFKGIVGGSATVEFYGRVMVDYDAQKTEAYQSNHNLLLSENARIGTMPQLEIYADDVKCSHGATLGSLNQEEQFYMRSRGIPEAEAKYLQILSFISPILQKIENESQREELSAQIQSAIRKMI